MRMLLPISQDLILTQEKGFSQLLLNFFEF
jgi:hypothetical protein